MIVPAKRVCTRCGEEFERTLLGVNLIATRYERCPHCKKWGKYRRWGGDVGEPLVVEDEGSDRESEEDRLRRRIEESRFEHP